MCFKGGRFSEDKFSQKNRFVSPIVLIACLPRTRCSLQVKTKSTMSVLFDFASRPDSFFELPHFSFSLLLVFNGIVFPCLQDSIKILNHLPAQLACCQEIGQQKALFFLLVSSLSRGLCLIIRCPIPSSSPSHHGAKLILLKGTLVHAHTHHN